MKDYFEYKGYLGSAELDTTSLTLVGKLLFIRDVIAYSSSTPEGLRSAFEEAVDDYLATCAEVGDQPEIPCKGSFNVRVGPDLHREAMLKARAKGIGLNEFICQAIATAVGKTTEQTVQHVHEHKHNHQHTIEVQLVEKTAVLTATHEMPAQWGAALAAGQTH